MFRWILAASFFGAVVCPGANHNHHECKTDCATNLQQFVMNYTLQICNSILPLNCDHVHVNHEVNATIADAIKHEHVCGSDGITYSHCEFAQQRCEYLYPNAHWAHGAGNTVDVQIKNYGTCDNPLSTTTQATSAPSTAAVVATHKPIVITTIASMPVTTTSMPVTTTNHHHVHDLMASVFCQNIAIISCNSGVAIVCGSDGQFYPNICELTKAACTNPTLDLVDDKSFCTP